MRSNFEICILKCKMISSYKPTDKEMGYMEEKTYKVMRGTGATNIALGIISIVVGVAAGTLLLISGAKLLANKKNIMF